ncbi:MAG: hypothetical protein ABSC48_02575 [Terracidiphilus sp.]
MSRALRSFSSFSVFLSCVLAFCLLPVCAAVGQANDYPLSGTVLASSQEDEYFYQVETGSRVYLMKCEKVPGSHGSSPDCMIDDRGIMSGDALRFRVEGDRAYLPYAKGEEELRIFTTELLVTPTLPPAAASESQKESNPASERGVAIGAGLHAKGEDQVGWSITPSTTISASTAPSYTIPSPTDSQVNQRTTPSWSTPSGPVMSSAPVMAIPVTGGPPVLVTPIAPIHGGFVTGVPVTGGPPVTGHTMGTPAGGGLPMGSNDLRATIADIRSVVAFVRGLHTSWVHQLRVQVGEKTYQLECSDKPCELDKKPIELGDSFMVRVQGKWAYLSSGSGSGVPEQKFRIGTDDGPN